MHGALKVVLARTPSPPPLVTPREPCTDKVWLGYFDHLISGSEGGTPPHGLLCTQRWSAADLSAAILFFSTASFSGINECRLASFKIEDGAPPLLLCRHGITSVLAFRRTGLYPPVRVIAL